MAEGLKGYEGTTAAVLTREQKDYAVEERVASEFLKVFQSVEVYLDIWISEAFILQRLSHLRSLCRVDAL